MAKLEHGGETWTDPNEIRTVLNAHGVPFESWGLRASSDAKDDEILSAYDEDIERLKNERGYVTADLVALNPDMPNLDTVLAKFDKEHHHTEDEVRFTVGGEGVFEIAGNDGGMLKVTTHPGDLIVVPAKRRHLFYLTEQKHIRCIRLFKTKEGWEAIYEPETDAS